MKIPVMLAMLFCSSAVALDAILAPLMQGYDASARPMDPLVLSPTALNTSCSAVEQADTVFIDLGIEALQVADCLGTPCTDLQVCRQ